MLKAAKSNNKRFDLLKLIESAVYIYNNTPHSGTKFAPIQLLRPTLLTPEKINSSEEILKRQRLQRNALYAQARANLKSAANKNDKHLQKKGKARKFEVGDKVLYRVPQRYRTKGQLPYDALGEVREILPNNRYVVEWSEEIPQPNLPSNFHASTLKRYKGENIIV